MPFPINIEYFRMNWNLHRCLLWLSVRNVKVTRVQIRNTRCLIETDQPVPDAELISVDGDSYARTNLNNCQVIWRQYPEVTP
jgi:hypothetical protein